jgi:hypothetical protein
VSFHGGEVGVVAAKESPDQWAEEVPHEQVIAGIVARRLRLVGRGHDTDRRSTDHHEAADACTVHGVRDGGRGWCNDPGLGCTVRTERGDHCIDVA